MPKQPGECERTRSVWKKRVRLNRLTVSSWSLAPSFIEIFVILSPWFMIRRLTVRVSSFDLLARCVESCAFLETSPSRIATRCLRRSPRAQAVFIIFLLRAIARAHSIAWPGLAASGNDFKENGVVEVRGIGRRLDPPRRCSIAETLAPPCAC